MWAEVAVVPAAPSSCHSYFAMYLTSYRQDYDLMGCDAVYSGSLVPAFQCDVLASYAYTPKTDTARLSENW